MSEWKYNEVQTPLEYEDYIDIVENSINEKISWLKNNRWKKEYTKNNIKVESSKIPTSTIKVIKITMTIQNKDIQKIINDFFNFNNRKTFDKNLISHKIIKNIDSKSFINYSVYKTPIVSKNRDFVCVKSIKKLNNNLYVVITKSINDKNIPFSDNIRGIINNGTFFEQNGNNLKITTVDHVNPKGLIPPMLTSIISKPMINILENINNYDKYVLKN